MTDPHPEVPCGFNGRQMSYDEIAFIAYSAGFNQPTNLPLAVAIAAAESKRRVQAKGDCRAIGKVGLCPSWGLWQIRSCAEMPRVSDALQLFNPWTNAAAAFKLYQSPRGFNHWTVYTTGTYLPHMSAAKAAAQKVLSGQPISVGGGAPATPGLTPQPGDVPQGAPGTSPVGNAIKDAAGNVIGFVTPWGSGKSTPDKIGLITKTAYIIGGAVALIVGITVIMQDIGRPILKQAAPIVSALAPVGRGVSAAANVLPITKKAA